MTRARAWTFLAPAAVSSLLLGWVLLTATNVQTASISLLVYGLANLIVYTDALDFLLRLHVRRRHTATASPAEDNRNLSIDLLGSLPDGIVAAEYAPFSELFPRAAAIVHQGGVGTTGQSMRAGRPVLVMPYSHDQPDNARRLVRLGMARTIQRGRYRADRAAVQLRELLDKPSYAERAAWVASQVREESGARTAADAIEKLQ